MKRIAVLLVLAGICSGMDCEGNMPDLAPEAPLEVPDPPLQDGAYGGPVAVRTTVSSAGSEPVLIVSAQYRIVEIVGGRIQILRRAVNMNGPFGCQSIEPGSQRIVAAVAGGLDGNIVETILGTTALGYDYVASVSFDGAPPLTGEGTAFGTPMDDGIDWIDTSGLTGFLSGEMVETTNTTTGFLQRIGDNGAVPEPDGMNGDWILRNTEGGQVGIKIRGLRVATYTDGNGAQEVTDSDPVTASSAPGDGVFFSFEAMVFAAPDPTLKLYRITFRGSVGPEGQITGETTFTTDGEEPIVLTLTLEREPSSDC